MAQPKRNIRTKRLRDRVLASIALQQDLAPHDFQSEKDHIRERHSHAIATKRIKSSVFVAKYEESLIEYFANGDEVNPAQIQPELRMVLPNTIEERLFRYATLLWSIPVSSGYGRRIRFVVVDKSNEKLIGLIGLGDPVYSIAARDKFIGWTNESKKNLLYHILDAFVLGAVPPYNQLNCGKLIALLALTKDVQDAFELKYANSTSRILERKRIPVLAALTTISALGRSSLYNRLRLSEQKYWHRVGITSGTGDLLLCNGVYDDLAALVKSESIPTAKQHEWGTGFRNRREVIKKGLKLLGISASLLSHGIGREIYFGPMCSNAVSFLSGKDLLPKPFNWNTTEMGESAVRRWIIGRAERCPDYKLFERNALIEIARGEK